MLRYSTPGVSFIFKSFLNYTVSWGGFEVFLKGMTKEIGAYKDECKAEKEMKRRQRLKMDEYKRK